MVTHLSSLLPLVPLGIFAGLLSGMLGIGGGLIFAPLLLALGLPPHQALATSTLAIVPTTLAGSWTHLRSGTIPIRAILAIAGGAVVGGSLFSHAGVALQGWHLLALQSALYGVLALIVSPRRAHEQDDGPGPLPLPGIAAVGLVAGAATGLLGLGGGLVMVPLMVQGLRLRVYLAIRLSTLAVCASASSASVGLLIDGRARPDFALLLGAIAALAAAWSAGRLQKVPEQRLVLLLRWLCLALALDGGRRALQLALA